MNKVLPACVLFVVGLFALISYANEVPVPDYVVKVRVETVRTQVSDLGTGFLIKSNLVLTNFHVVRDFVPGRKLTVEINGEAVDAVIVKSNPVKDLALLRIPEQDTDVVCLGEEPTSGSIVTAKGFKHGSMYIEASGRVIDRVALDKRGLPVAFRVRAVTYSGMSGGPVMQNDKLVGIIFGRRLLLCCTGVNAIRDFLGETEYWE